jgi:hypothetical protein
VTGSAVRDIEDQLRAGSIREVDITNAARALLAATRERLGTDSPAVQQLQAQWQQLRVPV